MQEFSKELESSEVIKLPFQPMLGNGQITVLRCDGFTADNADSPHRHDFYMIFWATQGNGKHFIDFTAYEISPGHCYFLHTGQVHQMITYPHSGWMILFGEPVLRRFLLNYPEYEQTGIFDYFNPTPFVNLEPAILRQLNNLCNWITSSFFDEVMPKNQIQQYVEVILTSINHFHSPERPYTGSKPEFELMRRFKILIEQDFTIRHDVKYYSDRLTVTAKKLNTLTRQFQGRTASELIAIRLLMESKALLSGSTLSLKEIAYKIGFSDPAYFGRFFRKLTNETPSSFRARHA